MKKTVALYILAFLSISGFAAGSVEPSSMNFILGNPKRIEVSIERLVYFQKQTSREIWEYWENGNVKEYRAINDKGQPITEQKFNTFGHVIYEVFYPNDPSRTEKSIFEFDANNRPIKKTTQYSELIFRYNDKNQLTKIYTANSPTNTQRLLQENVYDNEERLVQVRQHYSDDPAEYTSIVYYYDGRARTFTTPIYIPRLKTQEDPISILDNYYIKEGGIVVFNGKVPVFRTERSGIPADRLEPRSIDEIDRNIMTTNIFFNNLGQETRAEINYQDKSLQKAIFRYDYTQLDNQNNWLKKISYKIDIKDDTEDIISTIRRSITYY